MTNTETHLRVSAARIAAFVSIVCVLGPVWAIWTPQPIDSYLNVWVPMVALAFGGVAVILARGSRARTLGWLGICIGSLYLVGLYLFFKVVVAGI